MPRLFLATSAAIAVLCFTSIGDAKNEYLMAWQQAYPSSTIPDRMSDLLGAACWTCHNPPSFTNQGNCYREDIKSLLEGGMDIEDAILAVENIDSDGDGVLNVIEIMTVREDDPQQVGYNPGLVGDMGADPCGTPAGEVVSGVSETPTIGCDGDTNGDFVVDIDDIVNVVLDFGCTEPPDCPNGGDVNGDMVVNIDDIVFVVLNFGSTCP